MTTGTSLLNLGLVSLRCIPLQDETGQHIAPKGTKHSPVFGGLGGPQPPGHFGRLVPSALVLALWAKLSHSF